MQHSKNKIVPLTALVLLVISFAVHAQTGGDFKITKSTIDAGGGKSDGGGFIVDGTVGQVDASNELTGGGFALTGGFWAQETIPLPDELFKDGFEE